MKRIILVFFALVTLIGLKNTDAFGQIVWTKDISNPILSGGLSGSWDTDLQAPCVIFNPDSARYEMWFTGLLPMGRIGFAVSPDGINWTRDLNPVLSPDSGSWDELTVRVACVLHEDGIYEMWYTGAGIDPAGYIGYATSLDGRNWTKYWGNPVLLPGIDAGESWVGYCSVIKSGGEYQMYYTTGGTDSISYISRATSMDGITWQRDTDHNPVLVRGGIGAWDGTVFVPQILVIGPTYYMSYTAESTAWHGPWDIGLAISTDSGKTWAKDAHNPVLSPGGAGTWDRGWVEAGNLMLIGDTIHMWYDGGAPTSWIAKIGHATSPLVMYTITVTAGPNGTVTPTGTITLPYGSAQRITFVPDSEWYVDSLFVDGVLIDPTEEYTFTNLDADHTVRVVFNHPPVSVPLEVAQNWNLISVPVKVPDHHKDVLFPTSISHAYAYNASYVSHDILSFGVGYWLKFSSVEGLSFYGRPVTTDSIDVNARWNIIGSITVPVAVSNIQSDPGGIVTSPFYGYDGTYQIADTIQPGKAYWVKSGQTGKLILSSNVTGRSVNKISVEPTSELPPRPPCDAVNSQVMGGIPEEFELGQNYPNPFNPATLIKYQIPISCYVSLKIYDVLGREVATLVEGIEDAGYKSVTWNAGDVPSGIYFCRMTSGEYVGIRNLILMK